MLSSNCLTLPRLTFKTSGNRPMSTKLANPTLSFPILLPLFSLLSTNVWAGFKGTSRMSDAWWLNSKLLIFSSSAVASEAPGTDREIAALSDQFQQLRPEVLNTLSEFLS